MKKVVFAAIAYLMIIPAASAQQEKEPVQDRDEITLTLHKEGWVTTNTANVRVNFDIIQQKETALELKTQVMESLKTLWKNKEDWHITSSSENKDRTGLNRWHVMAEARVPEGSVSGLNDRAERASRPGFSIRIGSVDFSPSLAETEEVRAKLRAEIYAKAATEAASLTAVIPGYKYRVFAVDFGQNFRALGAAPMRAMTMQKQERAIDASNGQGPGGGAELAVSRRQSISATVVLTSAP